VDYDSGQPIYRQIIEDFKKRLVRGELQQGDRIPSQREYAEVHRVNPNTVQRAYREMEAMHMVQSLRGQGTFVRISGEELERIRMEMAIQAVNYLVHEMRSLGFTDQETLEMMARAVDEREAKTNDRV